VLGGRKPDELRAELEKLHQRRIHERKVEYRRSDGTLFPLTVADVYARRSALEMAYNPNDCAEVRWGADATTADYATWQTPRARRAAQPHAGVSDVVPRGAPPIAIAARAVVTAATMYADAHLGARTNVHPMKCFPSERPIYLMIGWHSSEDS